MQTHLQIRQNANLIGHTKTGFLTPELLITGHAVRVKQTGRQQFYKLDAARDAGVRLIDLLAKKIRHLRRLLRDEELRRLLAASAGEIPHDAPYKIGDTIDALMGGSISLRLKVYGIKAGGYGTVYTVLDEETLAPYCLKTVRDRSYDKRKTAERALREVEIWIKLGKHPNVAYAHSALEVHGWTSVLLEYVSGRDLSCRIKQGSLTVKEALNYAIQLCQGLIHAQNRLPGFVHGDIKPGNCLLTADGVLKLTDFGQAKTATELGRLPAESEHSSNNLSDLPINTWVAGTPPYMAPEQFEGSNKTDVRSDIYAFGITLFEMLTGQRPFTGRNYEECFDQHRSLAPPHPVHLNADIPERLANVLLRCLAKTPDERPPDFSVVEGELRRISIDCYGDDCPPAIAGKLTVEELLNRAASLRVLGKHRDALVLFDEVLQADPQSAVALILKGRTLSDLGYYGQAFSCLKEAVTLAPRISFTWSNIGDFYDRMGIYAEALRCFNQAISLQPKLAAVWNNKGHSLTELGRLEDAADCFKRAMRTDCHNPTAYNNLGTVYRKQGRDDEALECYKKAGEMHPLYTEAFCNLGDVYTCRGLLLDAAEAYRKAFTLRPAQVVDRLKIIYRGICSRARQILGDDCWESRTAFLWNSRVESSLVVNSCNQLLSMTGYDPAVFYMCSDKLLRSLDGIGDELQTTLIDSLTRVEEKLNEDNSHVFYWLGRTFYRLDLYDKCMDIFRRSISRSGSDARALYYIGACDELKGRYPEALDSYKQALTFNPACSLTLEAIRRLETKIVEDRNPLGSPTKQPRPLTCPGDLVA